MKKISYNKNQRILLDKLEMALVGLVHDGNTTLAKALAPIVDLLQQGNSVCALLESEASGFDERIVEEIRQVFDVRI